MKEGLWNFICGYANMSLSGQHTERFIRICCARGICLHSVKCREDVIEFCVDHRYTSQIDEIAEKCGLDILACRVHGTPVLRRRVLSSLGLLLGMLMALVVFFFGTSFITDVVIVGNVDISQADLLEFLEGQGITVGTVKYGLKDERISNALVISDPRVAWAEFDVSGTVATLTVSEANYIHGRPDDRVADVVAARDGYIIGITCLSGDAKVSAGEAVYAGQLLVSHYVSDMEQSMVNAKAVVVAIVWDTYSQTATPDTPEEEVWEMLRRRVQVDMEGMNYSIISSQVNKGTDFNEYTIVVESTTNIAETKYIGDSCSYDGNGENTD